MKRDEIVIYVDNAATTRIDNEVLEAMIPFLSELYFNPSGSYLVSRKIQKVINESREIIAEIIGSEPEEIYFTSGGSESDNWVLRACPLTENKQIVVSHIEHHAILNACQELQKRGRKISFIPVDLKGRIEEDVFNRLISNSNEIGLVSIMLANNEIGTIQDIAKFAKMSHEFGALFHTDAVQAVGHLPINVRAMEIDFMSASAHKFNGPKGIGFLYKRSGIVIDSLISGGKQEHGIRGGTENVAAIIGMAVALKINANSMEANRKHIIQLERYVRDFLAHEIKTIRFNGDINNHLPGNINVSFKELDGESIMNLLDLKGIYVSTGSACNEGMDEISHVIKAIAVPKDFQKGTIRISIGKNNTMEEMKLLCEELKKIYLKLK